MSTLSLDAMNAKFDKHPMLKNLSADIRQVLADNFSDWKAIAEYDPAGLTNEYGVPAELVPALINKAKAEMGSKPAEPEVSATSETVVQVGVTTGIAGGGAAGLDAAKAAIRARAQAGMGNMTGLNALALAMSRRNINPDAVRAGLMLFSYALQGHFGALDAVALDIARKLRPGAKLANGQKIIIIDAGYKALLRKYDQLRSVANVEVVSDDDRKGAAGDVTDIIVKSGLIDALALAMRYHVEYSDVAAGAQKIAGSQPKAAEAVLRSLADFGEALTMQAATSFDDVIALQLRDEQDKFVVPIMTSPASLGALGVPAGMSVEDGLKMGLSAQYGTGIVEVLRAHMALTELAEYIAMLKDEPESVPALVDLIGGLADTLMDAMVKLDVDGAREVAGEVADGASFRNSQPRYEQHDEPAVVRPEFRPNPGSTITIKFLNRTILSVNKR